MPTKNEQTVTKPQVFKQKPFGEIVPNTEGVTKRQIEVQNTGFSFTVFGYKISIKIEKIVNPM